MNALTRKLNRFLCACRGSWRNAVFVGDSRKGYLMALDRDAAPVVFDVETYRDMTGDGVEPEECCLRMSAGAFRTVFASWLCWQLSDGEADPLKELCKRNE